MMSIAIEKPSFILTDIEGTTTPKTFVYDVLFPYFIQHLGEVQPHRNEPEYIHALQLVKETFVEENKQEPHFENLINQLEQWVKEDRKHPGLKLLQGLIWENGYRKGKLKGEVYADVPTCLKKWRSQGIELGVYSSGSVQAQKLLFGFSNAGNLCTQFAAFFDTKIGHKREVNSYQNIIHELHLPAKAILFLSDISEELDAAAASGMSVIQIVRDETTLPSDKHKSITNFNAIQWI